MKTTERRGSPQRSLAILLILTGAATVAAADFDQYELVGSFQFPTVGAPKDQGPVVFDNLSDGRLLAVTTVITDPSNFLGSPKVYLETRAGSRSFQLAGDLPLPPGGRWSEFGGAFLRVSPGNGGPVQVAVGNNEPSAPLVGVFLESDLLSAVGAADLASLPIDWYGLDHFSAAWFDDGQLAINSGTGLTSSVRLLDTASPPAAPVRPLVIDGIAGASAGVGFDSAGNLYTANGFATDGPSTTGDIRRFDAADWQQALASGTPLGFEQAGTHVDTILSGGSLVLDRQDNLLVGGSDAFGSGESNFFALLPAAGVPAAVRTFDPDDTADNFYALAYNDLSREIYANDPFALDNTMTYVYRPYPLGDMDCDGDVDFDDIEGLVLGLTDPVAYESLHDIPASIKGDVDGDGDLDFDDIGPFVELLIGPPLQAVPEPGTLVLLGLVAPWVLIAGRSRISNTSAN